jgi:predicted O-methyltransferase YrrM
MLPGKIESAIWFLKRPHLLPEFFQRARAVEIDEAILRLTGSRMDQPVSVKFEGQFREASARAKDCPVTMGGPGALDLLYWSVLRRRARRVVETGVAYGWSSFALLLAMEDVADARLISTDMPYVRENNDDYVGVIVPENLKKKWELVRLPDRQGLPKALAKLGRIDLCHYDSDKSYAGRMWAYPRLWDALDPGGCFISDDINDNVGFRDFALTLGVEPLIVRVSNDTQAKYVGILVKPAS